MIHPPERSGLMIVVSGASGLIGSAVVSRLSQEGHRVRPLVRRPASAGEISWDPAVGRLDPSALEGTDAVIHLAGENVGRRWTRSRKLRIRESRVRGTRLLCQSLARLARPPAVVISASAVGIYGNRGDEVLTDTSPPGNPAEDFLVSVCMQWEAAASPARDAGIRVVHPRFGLVLSPQGGALSKLLPIFRLGLGGRLGSGNQWMSWISIEDTVGAIRHLLNHEAVEGTVNVTAPEPVTNRDLVKSLGRVLGRPALVPVPGLALRLALGEMADTTLLAGSRVIPGRLLQSGYSFAHPDLDSALEQMLRGGRSSSFPL